MHHIAGNAICNTELCGHWMCTATVRHCVVSNSTDIGGMQLVVSWTVMAGQHMVENGTSVGRMQYSHPNCGRALLQ